MLMYIVGVLFCISNIYGTLYLNNGINFVIEDFLCKKMYLKLSIENYMLIISKILLIVIHIMLSIKLCSLFNMPTQLILLISSNIMFFETMHIDYGGIFCDRLFSYISIYLFLIFTILITIIKML